MSLLAMVGTGYDAYQQIALVLFFVAFVAVVIWAWTRSRRQMDDLSRLPLDRQPEDMDHE